MLFGFFLHSSLLVSTGLGTLCLTAEHQAVDVVILLGFECSVETVVLCTF